MGDKIWRIIIAYGVNEQVGKEDRDPKYMREVKHLNDGDLNTRVKNQNLNIEQCQQGQNWKYKEEVKK